MSEPHLFDTLDNLRGIGRLKAKTLAKLGLNRILDILFFFPRDYEDYSEIRDIGDLEDGESTSIIGEVIDFELVQKFGGRSAFYLLVEQGDHSLRGIWFNQPYRANKIDFGVKVMLSGKTKLNGTRFEMMHPRMVVLEDPNEIPKGTLLPIYRLTEGIKQPELRRIIKEVIDSHTDLVDEIFPDWFLSKNNLLGIQQALRNVHFPESPEDVVPARRRFVFQELLTLQLAIQLRRKRVQQEKTAPSIENSSLIDSRIRKYFSYRLTGAQDRSIEEIAADMSRTIPMNRMLHGDVGCGKTSVAVYSLLLAVANGYQGVLMAPTETLAQQHYRNLQHNLATARVQVDMLTGSLSRKEKTAVLQRIASGETGIVVGTQALIQNELEFSKLGLVIVDEQHRFGVKQRAILRQKGVTPHYLVMTATPIPRTVSMTLFGDLDVSVIDERPPNRPAVNTYLCDDSQKEKWWEFVRKKLREGRQAYVIAPLVDQDENENWESVEENFENLANGEFADFNIDLVHGNQPAVEKNVAMKKFADGETQVLVATSVVEVGIDVPNATVMTILSASRFGISQLHQLRGRVCRGGHAGFVTLFSDAEGEESKERLQSLVDIDDGFKLAEVDFQLRGPGDLFGTKQHGMPPLYVANLQTDFDLLVEAREEAKEILDKDPTLESSEFAEIKNRVMTRYGKSLELSDVG